MARIYVCQRELVDALIDFQARQIERYEADRAELRRLTALASVLEAGRRKDGNAERIANMLAPDVAASNPAG